MKIGTKVNVYQKPITLEDFEEVGIIKSEPIPVHDFDINGNPLFRCNIKFGSEWTSYPRMVSEVANHE